MGTVIKVENLSKKYIISHKKNERYTALRDVIANNSKNMAKKILKPFSHDKSISDDKEEFWALKDISFEVQQGDKIGIIGRNGAGKSTLLKIISRITEPTTGKIGIKGRVASLLEVGTGFHPELTGRENIYLNGAILGMTRNDIKKRFDEIVEFAEVEKFLDTPVKRYSSGMYMRLAFSVAAHLEPDILIVDEVLAVGDAQFQKKCLGKMKDVGDEGRTVIFVSHTMDALRQLCNRGILLEKGSVILRGNEISSVIKSYVNLNYSNENENEWINYNKERLSNQWFTPIKFNVVDECGNKVSGVVQNDSDMYIQINGEIEKANEALVIGYAIYDDSGNMVYLTTQKDEGEKNQIVLHKGSCILRSKVPKRFLNEGNYRVELVAILHNDRWLFTLGNNAPTICFKIRGGLSDSSYWVNKRPGILAPELRWELLE